MSQKISVEDNKKTIGRLFDSIARRYDLLNHLLTLNIDKIWRRQTIKHIDKANIFSTKQTVNALDVAVGTGDLMIQIIKSIVDTSLSKSHTAKKTSQHDNSSFDFRITGIDLSEQMLKICKTKIHKFFATHQSKEFSFDKDNFSIQTQNVTLSCNVLQSNVENMPFEDNHFALVTCGFGARNFNHLDKGLQEMYRVLQPNGQIVILEFAYPKNMFIRFIYNIYFTYILPFIGRIISKDNTAYKYLMQSVKEFPKNDMFLKHLVNCGFQKAEFHSLTFGIANIYTAYKNH